ncbi:TraR/DksA family transcriptional regulator [Aquihabitans sp. McL0605]|uniref:TraR/DksA family transcriptional regulator n=1 Tax=Aquihabitans sp. McL0605 TaxID=3415671 RepID=UPI003CEA1ACA
MKDHLPSEPLSTEQAELLSQLIAAERSRLQTQVDGLRRTFDELVAAADLEPPDDEHDPDGTTAYERAQVTSLRASSDRTIAQLDDALLRLHQGRYGRCVRCGAPVPFDRLVAVLGTDRCVRCAAGRA